MTIDPITGYSDEWRQGANAQLEACCKWLESNFMHGASRKMREAMRANKQLKTKEQLELKGLD